MFGQHEFKSLSQILNTTGYGSKPIGERGMSISGYAVREDDVIFQHRELSMGGCQLVGKRYATKLEGQEDRFGANVLPNLDKLDMEDKKILLDRFVQQLQTNVTNNLGSAVKHRGASLCVAVNDGNGIHVINVGDCRCYVVVWDEKGKITSCVRVNDKLHNAGNDAEVIRVSKKLGITPADKAKALPLGRLGGRLEMTRSIGDNGLEEKGLSHEGEYFYNKVQEENKGRAILIVASDGIVESWIGKDFEDAKTESAKLKAALENIQHSMELPVDVLSFEMAKHACEGGSHDNLTVISTEIGGKNSSPLYTYVADGHNGSQVSAEINKIFDETINKCLIELCQEKGLNSSLKTTP